MYYVSIKCENIPIMGEELFKYVVMTTLNLHWNDKNQSLFSQNTVCGPTNGNTSKWRKYHSNKTQAGKESHHNEHTYTAEGKFAGMTSKIH